MIEFFDAPVLGIPASAANWIALLAIILIALLLLWIVMRLIRMPRLAGGRRSKHARLAVTDAAQVDDRRRIVLVRRDDVEHLIMIGGGNDLVIESDIRQRPATAQAKPAAKPAPAPARPAAAKPAEAPKPAPAPAPKPEPAPTASTPVAPAQRPAQPAQPVRSEPTISMDTATEKPKGVDVTATRS